MSELTIVEINGIKMEVDLRHAKKIEQYKVGDIVKVLVKEYGDTYASCPGVIIGFDNYQMLPTITVCYLKPGYNAEVKFISINSKTVDIEICHMPDHEKMLDSATTVQYLDREILKKETEVMELKQKKSFFIENYNKLTTAINSPKELE
jgi:hypothetical protein